MSSWKKRIKRKFGRYSGDVSPPAALLDDLPPPFARSLSLRHPGYTSRDGDPRPESFLLLDEQRIPTLRRTWSFRQAVAKFPTSQHPNGGFFNSGGGSTLPDCPGSPSSNKPLFFSRLFRFSSRDKNRKAGTNLPPSVAHVDVIRKNDPESSQVEPDGVFPAENLSQWPSVQSDIVTSFVEPSNDAATATFMSQWASVPMDMTSSHACHSSEWISSQDNCGETVEPPEVDDDEDPDVVVIRRSSTLPSFRSRSGFSSSEGLADAANDNGEVSNHDDNERVHDVGQTRVQRSANEARLANCHEAGQVDHCGHKAVPPNSFVDPGAKEKRKIRRTSAELQQKDELKYVLLNGSFPPKRKNSPEAPETASGQLVESPCSEDSAVFDLSPLNPLLKNTDPRPCNRKYKVDSAIFDCRPKPSTLPPSSAGPVIELEDPKATRRRFEAQLPSSCRPASVSPVRDPAVLRRVKKMTSAVRPMSYTAGIGPMQRASTDLHQVSLLSSKRRLSKQRVPLMLERSCSAEALALEIGDDKPPESGDASSANRDTATLGGSELSDEVDSGTFVRKKPIPLKRSGTFTKEDSGSLQRSESPAKDALQTPDEVGTEVQRATEFGTEAQPKQPKQSGIYRGELRKPSEHKVGKGTKELHDAASDKGVSVGVNVDNNNNNNNNNNKNRHQHNPRSDSNSCDSNNSHKQRKLKAGEDEAQISNAFLERNDKSKKNSKLQVPVVAASLAPAAKNCSKVPTSLKSGRGTPKSSSRKKFVQKDERSLDSSPTISEAPIPDDQPKLIRSITPVKSRLAPPSKIGKPCAVKKSGGVRSFSKSPVINASQAAAGQSPLVAEDSPPARLKSEPDNCLVESVTRAVEEVQEKIRLVMRQTVSSNARRKKPIDCKELSSTDQQTEANKVGDSEVGKRVAPKTSHAAKLPSDGVGTENEKQSSKVAFEAELARLGELCEARGAELDLLRQELQKASVAHGAIAFAAHHWSGRLRKTEQYSVRLRGQLQVAERLISNAHIDIENLENRLQQEVATHKEELDKFEETTQQKIVELEAKQAAALQELEAAYKRKIDELKSSLASASEDTVHKSKLTELKNEHSRTLEALKEKQEAEIDALREIQRDLERQLAQKKSQCRRVEEEAAALKSKLLQSADARAQWLNEKISSLEKEVESLNAVLEMKVAENRELLMEKHENQDKKKRLALMQEALDKQKAKIEDLKAQLDIKTETQQKLTSENVKLLELSEKKDRIISKMDRHFEELKYKMQDGSSFTVDVSTPAHPPLRGAKSVGSSANGSELEDSMSRSWHLSFQEKAQKDSSRSRSISSDSKTSEEEVTPHALENVFSQEEHTVLGEAVSTPVAAASTA